MPMPRRRFPIPRPYLQLALVIMGGWLVLTSGRRLLLADPTDGARIRAAGVPGDSTGP